MTKLREHFSFDCTPPLVTLLGRLLLALDLQLVKLERNDETTSFLGAGGSGFVFAVASLKDASRRYALKVVPTDDTRPLSQEFANFGMRQRQPPP